MERTGQTATKVNTIRRQQSGEPASQWRSPEHPSREAEARDEAVSVVGGSMSGKGSDVNTGDLSGQNGVHAAKQPKNRPAGVRVAIVAGKPVNAGGAKGGRKADSSSQTKREEPSPEVPLGDKQGEEDLWQRHKAKRGVWSEKMLAALERGVKGNKWFSLIDKVWSERTLGLAWEKVKTNAGGCGVDNITVARFAKDSQRRLLVVKEQLERGDYQPRPVKRVWIPKAGSREKRPLGIPTVTDRVVQTALRMAIEPIFEKEFAPHSYGFRPGRGCKDALRHVDGLLKSGRLHVVEVDLKGYFDSIPHGPLMERVRERVADGRVLALVESFLKQGVMEQMGEIEPATGEGAPQGAVISPLLANIYLNPLDWQMAGRGRQINRYADDMVVLCETAQEAREAKQELEAWCEAAGLELHPEKTKIVDMGQPGAHFDYLGYRFLHAKRTGRLCRLIRPKSLKAIKGRIKPLTKRANGRSLEELSVKLEPILRGVHGYFQHALASQLRQLDGWVRGRLRGILRKRHKGRGMGRGKDHQKWPNDYFDRHGLFSLAQARETVLASLREGVNC